MDNNKLEEFAEGNLKDSEEMKNDELGEEKPAVIPIMEYNGIYVYPPTRQEKTIDMTNNYIFTEEECDRLFFYANHFRMDKHNNLSKLDTQIFEKLFKITHGNYNIMEDENV